MSNNLFSSSGLITSPGTSSVDTAQPYKKAFGLLNGWAKGSFSKVLSVCLFVASIGSGVAGNSAMAIVVALSSVVIFTYGTDVIDAMFVKQD